MLSRLTTTTTIHGRPKYGSHWIHAHRIQIVMMVTLAMVLRLVPPASALLVSRLRTVGMSLVWIVYLILCISILAHPTHYFLFLVVMTSVRQARILHHVLPTVAPSSLRLRLKITMALVAMSSRYEQRKISL